MVRIRQVIEGAGFLLISRIFKSLSLEKASSLGGWMGRRLGLFFPLSKTAYHNLSVIFPRLTHKEKESIVFAMWQEWGRVAAEYFHIDRFIHDPSLITVEGIEILEALKHDQKPALLFSGHLSHFQLGSIAALVHGLPLVQFYRGANNPIVDRRMYALQQQMSQDVIRKRPSGTKSLIRALMNGKHVFMMVDQKFHQGELIPFLGKPALTALSIITLSQRFCCPLVPVRVQRTAPLHFHVTFYEPIPTEASVKEIGHTMNALLGEWIKERPEQWFWIHKRWPFSQ